MSTPLRVLIVDDHPIVRRGIREILKEDSDIEAVGEATNPSEALMQLRARAWSVVLLDIGLTGRGGLELLKELRTEFPTLPVLVLSTYSEEQYAIRALRAGAAGYLAKNTAPDQLLAAVRRVVTGGRYISTSVAERLAAELMVDRSRPLHETLSDREFDVFKRIGAGMTVSQIANALALSVKTVSGYRANIVAKTGLANNASIMKYVLDHRLLD